MTEKEFQRKRDEIQKVLRFVLESEYSNFYRSKYKGLGIKPEKINTYDDFKNIPALTKDEILAVPIGERTYVPQKEIFRYSSSSGTTANNKILVMAHNDPPNPETYTTYDPKLFSKLGVKKILALLIPNSSVMNKMLSIPNREYPIIPADLNRLPLTAKIASEIQPEAIFTTPTILYNFSKELEKTNFDFNQVRYISLGGEYTTQLRYDYFKKIFPNAFFKFRFGNSEIGSRVAMRCDILARQNPSYFHASPRDFVELVDISEESGELLYTHVVNKAFPMIRYRTGDIARVVAEECKCGAGPVIDVGGRKQYDVLKIGGAIVHTAAIAAALKSFTDKLLPNFQMHVSEETHNRKIATRLELWIEPKDKKTEINSLTKEISRRLFLAPDKTLDFYVEKGIFLPLILKTHHFSEDSAKSKNIISHLE